MNALACVSVALLGLIVLPQVAVADSTADAIRKWGLLGTWALDCSKPASLQQGGAGAREIGIAADWPIRSCRPAGPEERDAMDPVHQAANNTFT